MRALSPDERHLVATLNGAASVTNLRAIANGKRSQVDLHLGDFERARVAVSQCTVHALLNDGLDWMSRHHRSERLYKAVIARKILKGRHSLRTSALVSEFRVGDSIADCVVVNGNAHVYEIKTELDDASKLQKQILDYQRAFSLVTVVTHESLADRYVDLLPSAEVGVLALSARGVLSSRRPAQPRSDRLDIRAMFTALRQREFMDIERRMSGKTPTCRPVATFDTYLDLALRHDATTYSTEFERQLRERKALLADTLTDELFEPVLAQCATINPTALQAQRIRAWLESEVD